LAAELGHDHAVGASNGCDFSTREAPVFIALLASIVVSGLLAFWPDFSHSGPITPFFDPYLVLTLLIGPGIGGACPVLWRRYAYCSDRGALLARAKLFSLSYSFLCQLRCTLFGPLGMASPSSRATF